MAPVPPANDDVGLQIDHVRGAKLLSHVVHAQ